MNLSKTEKVMKKVGKSLSDLLSDKERKKEKMPVETYWNFLKIKENRQMEAGQTAEEEQDRGASRQSCIWHPRSSQKLSKKRKR